MANSARPSHLAPAARLRAPTGLALIVPPCGHSRERARCPVWQGRWPRQGAESERSDGHVDHGPAARLAAGAPPLRKVEAVEIHDLVPRRDEVLHELLLRVVAGVDLGDGAELGVEPKTRSTAVPVHLSCRSRGRGPRRRARPGGHRHSVPMSSRFTKKSLVSVSGRSVKTPCSDWPEFASRTRRPPTSTVISGAVSVSRLARSTSSSSGRRLLAGSEVVAEAVSGRLEHGKRLDVGLLLRCVRAPRRERNLTSCPAFLAACSTAAHPPRTIRSARDTFFPPVCELLKSAWIPSRVCSTVASSAGLLTSQSFCGARRIRAPLAPPRLSVSRKVEADAHAVATSWETDSPEARILALEGRDVVRVDQLVIDGGDRVLPDQLLGGTPGPR